MEENFNVDNDRLERQHELFMTLKAHRAGELELSEKKLVAIENELKVLLDADTRKYISDNEYAARIEVAEIEAKNKLEIAKVEADSRVKVAEVQASSEKESIIKPILAYGVPTLITGATTFLVTKYKIDRYEAQHKIDQEYDMTGTLSDLSKGTERKYKPYDQR